jgi:Flp pilus assembly protein TadG
VLLMLAVIVCCGLLAVGVGAAGSALRERQQAQIAADAAALAGVTGGRDAAARLARANGGSLVAFARSATVDRGWDVRVTVAVGTGRASARATNGP